MFKLFARIAYTIAVLIQSLLALRFVIILFKVNTGNQIIKWVMDTSDPFVSPFIGVIEKSVIQINGFNADLTTVVAWFFYLIAGFIAIEIVKAFSTD